MKIVDLFAGCGGMSLGFQNAGYEILAAYDICKPAVDVYRLNFTDHSMRWSVDGAQSLLTLRAKVESNLWHEVVSLFAA